MRRALPYWRSMRARNAFVEHLNRLAPRSFLAVVDLAQIQQMALHHPAARRAPVLDNAEVAVLLAVLRPTRLA
jgi:hypothetical protein